MASSKFCVYLYADPKSGVWRYVGEGSLTRPFDHFKRTKNHRFSNMLQKRVAEGYLPKPLIIDAVSKDDAQEMEELLIGLLGREDLGLGTLFNLTNGGDGGKGRKQPLSERKMRSEIAMLQHSDPIKKNKHVEGCKSGRDNNIAAQKKRWTEERRNAWSTQLTTMYAAGRKTNSEALRRYFANPDARAKNAELQRVSHNKPEVKQKRTKKCTVDNGATVYQSCRDLINTLGQGINGYGSPNFAWIIDGVIVKRAKS